MPEPNRTRRRTPTERILVEYLGRVRSNLPVGSGADVTRELESSILDRADHIAAASGTRADANAVSRALDEVGEPERVAASYSTQDHLLAPESRRGFLLATVVVFAIHFALVGVATSLGRALHAGPFAVAPVGPHGVFSLGAAALHALLLDIGLVFVVFSAAPQIGRLVRPRVRNLGVDVAPRAVGARAVLSILVGCVLGLFRDRLFVIVDGSESHPLFTPWFGESVPLVTGLLGLAVVVDVVYMVWGERRRSLALDALHGAATLAVMLHLLRGGTLLEVPAHPEYASFRVPINGFLDDLGTIVLLVIATLAAVKTVRRIVRCAQV